ncbi:MAG: DUF748 domain-containing protein [Candidatus Omnitrophota bacterium]
MKLRERILFVITISLVVFLGSTYLFFLIWGKAITIKRLQEITKKKVTIGYFNVSPPLKIEIKNLNIEGLAEIESIDIRPNILGFLSGTLVLDTFKVTRPKITYERTPENIRRTPLAIANALSLSGIKSRLKNKYLSRVIFRRLYVKEGKVDFIDKTVGPSGIKITVKDIDCKLENLYIYPRSVIANLELTGKIPWQEGQEEGEIDIEGWFNPHKKDMQATLKISQIDGIYLYPYYSAWFDLDKARIEKAKLNFISSIRGIDNDVNADCRIELTDIVRKPRPKEEPADKMEKITDAVMDIFKAMDQGKIVLDFNIRTKMNKPKVGLGPVKTAFEGKIQKGMAGGFKAQDIIFLPGNIVIGTLKGATEVSTALIGGVFSIGTILKSTAEDSFKKEN